MGKKREKKFIPETRISRPKNNWKKIVWKKCEIRCLLTQEYRDQKFVGKKRVKKIFQKHSNRISKKCWKKIVWKKCENTFFLTHEYRDEKSGEKKARKKFSKNTRIGYQKNDGKKSSGKIRKHVFL